MKVSSWRSLMVAGVISFSMIPVANALTLSSDTGLNWNGGANNITAPHLDIGYIRATTEQPDGSFLPTAEGAGSAYLAITAVNTQLSVDVNTILLSSGATNPTAAWYSCAAMNAGCFVGSLTPTQVIDQVALPAAIMAGDTYYLVFAWDALDAGTQWTINLTSSVVPLPGSLVLFGSGLAGLVALGRKRKRTAERVAA